jgi:methyl-accepting chemotaxis protein
MSTNTGFDSRVVIPLGLAGAGAVGTIVAGWSRWGWYTLIVGRRADGAGRVERAAPTGRQWRRQRRQLPASNDYLQSREQFSDAVLPVWCRHIEFPQPDGGSRFRSGLRFSNIVDKLDTAVHVSSPTAGGWPTP